MALKIFTVILDEGAQSDVLERLENAYQNVFHYTDTVFFVACETKVTSGEIATKAKIKGDDRDASGVVFKLNSAYSGYTRRDLWEWLSEAEDG